MSQTEDQAVLAKVTQAETAGELSGSAAANIRRWLTEAPFSAYRSRLVVDIDAGRFKVLDDAFYAILEFGTGGRRGKMPTRMMREFSGSLRKSAVSTFGYGILVTMG